jgi:hypothetical protein
MATTLEADHGALAEELIDSIEALDNTAAPLRAVYGSFGTFEYERKNLCAPSRTSCGCRTSRPA